MPQTETMTTADKEHMRCRECVVCLVQCLESSGPNIALGAYTTAILSVKTGVGQCALIPQCTSSERNNVNWNWSQSARDVPILSLNWPTARLLSLEKRNGAQTSFAERCSMHFIFGDIRHTCRSIASWMNWTVWMCVCPDSMFVYSCL